MSPASSTPDHRHLRPSPTLGLVSPFKVTPEPFPTATFTDVLAANERFAADYHAPETLTGRAAKGLAVVTCMDSRVDPLEILGMGRGDVKILRNAGARVTEDVLRTLALAAYLLDVDRVLVMPHTDCRMAKGEEADVHAAIYENYGVDTRSMEFAISSDQVTTLRRDVIRVRAFPLLPTYVVVGGAIYDVTTGELRPQDI